MLNKIVLGLTWDLSKCFQLFMSLYYHYYCYYYYYYYYHYSLAGIYIIYESLWRLCMPLFCCRLYAVEKFHPLFNFGDLYVEVVRKLLNLFRNQHSHSILGNQRGTTCQYCGVHRMYHFHIYIFYILIYNDPIEKSSINLIIPFN